VPFFVTYPIFILPSYRCFIFLPLNSKEGKSGQMATYNIDIYGKSVYITNMLQLYFKKIILKKKPMIK